MSDRLTKITTRTGDDGTTMLADGSRVDKDTARITAIGDIDELNSLIGVIIASKISDDISGYLLNIQHRLFDMGGELAIPGQQTLAEESVLRLEDLIQNYNDDLPTLREFVLPGGNMPGALMHMARCVCRRAERHVIHLSREAFVNPITIQYLNRLSDLLFIFARTLVLQKGGKEIYWKVIASNILFEALSYSISISTSLRFIQGIVHGGS